MYFVKFRTAIARRVFSFEQFLTRVILYNIDYQNPRTTGKYIDDVSGYGRNSVRLLYGKYSFQTVGFRWTTSKKTGNKYRRYENIIIIICNSIVLLLLLYIPESRVVYVVCILYYITHSTKKKKKKQ